MTQAEFISELIAKIEAAGIPYMVTGSFASSYHGEPRSSNDADLVIAPTLPQLDKLIGLLGDEYYVDPATAKEAFRKKTMFNVIDSLKGWKADLILRKDREFSREEFSRRIPGSIAGRNVLVASPEDIILAKLEWAKSAGSEMQFRDALGVAVVQWDELDRDYLSNWADKLGIGRELKILLDQAKKLQPESDR